jgi:hypothetical protein
MLNYNQENQTKIFASQSLSSFLFQSFHLIGSLIGSFIAIIFGSIGVIMLNASQDTMSGMLGGAILVAASFGLLYGLARSRGEFTLERALLLTASCTLGGMGVLFASATGIIVLALIGLVLGIAGSVGVWLAVWNVSFVRSKTLTGRLA